MFLTGESPGNENNRRLAARFAQAVADARALLNRRPLTTALDDERLPGTFAPDVLAAMCRHTELRSLLDPLQQLKFPDDGPISTTLETFRFLLDACVDEAVLRGACVMHCLLQDGAR